MSMSSASSSVPSVPALSCYELYHPPGLHPRAIQYPLLERPPWRSTDLPSTSAMLAEIVDCQRRYENLPPRARQWITGTYSRIAAAQWVLSSNRLEGLGTQDVATTEHVVEQYYAQLDTASSAAQAALSAQSATPLAPAASAIPLIVPADAASFAAVAASDSGTDVAIKRKETLQTMAAMSLLYSDLQEMKANEERDRLQHPCPADAGVQYSPNDVLLLSTEMVCQAHQVLMNGLMHNAAI